MAVRNLIFAGTAALLAGFLANGSVLRRVAAGWPRKLVKALAIAVCGALALAVALFPGLPGVRPTGPYPYQTAVVQIDDESRPETFQNGAGSRKLSVLAYYPAGEGVRAGSCPLVVFSHGGVSLATGNVSLFAELASHGYVVASVAHTYHALSAAIDGRNIPIAPAYTRELQTEDSHRDIANSVACYRKWMDLRTGDIEAVLDAFLAEARQPDNDFYSLVDPDRVGLAGHSLGGAAALGVAHRRGGIAAVAALEAPYLCDVTGYEGDAFTWDTAPYDCAMLNIYSDTGFTLVGTDHKYARNAHYLYNDDRVEYLHIPGSNHYTLTDLVRTSPPLCVFLGGGYTKSGYDTLQAVNETALAFFERHLRGET